MKIAIKNLISFLLPLSVLILVPYLIEKNISIKHLPFFLAGLIIIALGLFVMIKTISLFIIIGKGTLAPWSPTRKLVTEGIYGHVRNPMIMGVIIVLTGESIAIESLNILVWTLVFFIVNSIYFSVYEEPGLVKRFGNEYIEYRKNVRRWIPKYKPYKTSSNPGFDQ